MMPTIVVGPDGVVMPGTSLSASILSWKVPVPSVMERKASALAGDAGMEPVMVALLICTSCASIDSGFALICAIVLTSGGGTLLAEMRVQPYGVVGDWNGGVTSMRKRPAPLPIRP